MMFKQIWAYRINLNTRLNEANTEVRMFIEKSDKPAVKEKGQKRIDLLNEAQNFINLMFNQMEEDLVKKQKLIVENSELREKLIEQAKIIDFLESEK